MRCVICDICGKEIPLEDRRRVEKSLDIQKIIGSEIDVCPRCHDIGTSLDPAAILLEAWKNQVMPERQALKVG